MKNVSISFCLKRNTYDEFIIDLYRYLLEFKQCIYIKLIFEPKISNVPESNILNRIFDSYTCEKLIDSTFYLENLYDESIDDDSPFGEDLVEECFGNYQVVFTSFRDSKLIQGIITDFSYSNIKNIQKLNYNQIMLFTKINDYDSIILGAYDYETLFSINKVDMQEISVIKELFASKYDIKNLKIDDIYEDDING